MMNENFREKYIEMLVNLYILRGAIEKGIGCYTGEAGVYETLGFTNKYKDIQPIISILNKMKEDLDKLIKIMRSELGGDKNGK